MDTVYCRFCFTNRNDLTEICDETRDSFYSLTNIQLSNSEIHSNLICQECKDKLQSTRDYVRLLAENELRLSNEYSHDDPLQHENQNILSYFPRIKTEKCETNRNLVIDHKIKGQKRTFQQMSKIVSTGNFEDSRDSDGFGNDDTSNDMTANTTNEGISEQTLSVEMIDNISDLEDAKNVFRLMLHEIRGSKTLIAPKMKPQSLVTQQITNPTKTAEDKNVKKSGKVSNVFEFETFIKTVNSDAAYRDYLIDHWKNLANNTRQAEVNAKAYNILNELFERDFLVSSVRWGQPFEKDKIRDDQVYLKLQDEFNDIILSVYGLERSKDSLEHIAKIFKNVFNNKVRREEKKTAS